MPEYWMRSIDFAKVAELLKLIINSPSKWSAIELNRAATDSGIFITSEGKPFSPTSCYRYRRIIEKLNLVEKRNRKFVPKLMPGECDKILAHSKTGELNNGAEISTRRPSNRQPRLLRNVLEIILAVEKTGLIGGVYQQRQSNCDESYERPKERKGKTVISPSRIQTIRTFQLFTEDTTQSKPSISA